MHSKFNLDTNSTILGNGRIMLIVLSEMEERELRVNEKNEGP